MKSIAIFVVALIALWFYALSAFAVPAVATETRALQNEDAMKMALIGSCQEKALMAMQIQHIRKKYHHDYTTFLKYISKYAENKVAYQKQFLAGTWVYKNFKEKESLRTVFSVMFKGCLAVQRKALEEFYKHDQQKRKYKRNTEKTPSGGDKGWTLHPKVRPDSKYYDPKKKLWNT